jgi:hypothetical protein
MLLLIASRSWDWLVSIPRNVAASFLTDWLAAFVTTAVPVQQVISVADKDVAHIG